LKAYLYVIDARSVVSPLPIREYVPNACPCFR
jgi:hypothetical protein